MGFLALADIWAFSSPPPPCPYPVEEGLPQKQCMMLEPTKLTNSMVLSDCSLVVRSMLSWDPHFIAMMGEEIQLWDNTRSLGH